MNEYLPLTVPHFDDLQTEQQIEIEAVAVSALDFDVDLGWHDNNSWHMRRGKPSRRSSVCQCAHPPSSEPKPRLPG